MVQDKRVETELVGEVADLLGVDGFRAAKAQSLRARCHGGRSEPTLDGVYGVSRHLTVGRQLAARDGDEPGRRSHDLVASGEVSCACTAGMVVCACCGQQGTQSRPARGHVLRPQRRGDGRVHSVEHIGDVARLDAGIVQRSCVVRVGRPDIGVLVPRYERDRAAVFGDGQHRRDITGQFVARDREMDALGGADRAWAGRVIEAVQFVGPYPGRVDDDSRPDLDHLRAGVVA